MYSVKQNYSLRKMLIIVKYLYILSARANEALIFISLIIGAFFLAPYYESCIELLAIVIFILFLNVGFVIVFYIY